MSANQAQFSVAGMCRALGLSECGYYASLKRAPSARSLMDSWLLERIQASHAASRGTYRAPRVHADLAAQGIRVGEKRVARLMRNAGLEGISPRKRVTTTIRSEGDPIAPDLVERKFQADGPDKLWVSDNTYVPTLVGFLYLAIVLDVWSRKIVGWSMSSSLATPLVLAALEMAVRQRQPAGTVHHSDQGCQYTSVAYGQHLIDAGIKPSATSPPTSSKRPLPRPRSPSAPDPLSNRGDLTASRWGSRFVERMLTVCESLRAQGRSILEFVERAIRARLTGAVRPSLLPARD